MRILFAVTACLALSACATGPMPVTSAAPGAMVSGQTPSGVYGISVPEVYYQPANSFPPGAAGVDGRAM